MAVASPIWVTEQTAEPSSSAVVEALVERFGDRFCALGPWWVRSEPQRWLWIGSPLAILVLAAPSPLLRITAAVAVAVGVGLHLQWQNALAVQRRHSDAFVTTLATDVAAQLEVELPPMLVEEIASGHFRPGIDQVILHAATKANAGRGSRS